MQSHTNIDFNLEHSFSTPMANLICFLGGFIINIFSIHISPSNLEHLYQYVVSPEGVVYIVHSVIGGFIALFFKLLHDAITYLIKRRKENKNKGGNHVG